MMFRFAAGAPGGALEAKRWSLNGLWGSAEPGTPIAFWRARSKQSVTVQQDLSVTDAGLLPDLLEGLTGAYFTGDLEPEVIALEILELSILDGLSGYVIATDRGQ